MHLFSTIVLASAASTAVALSGQLTSFMANSGFLERQTQICQAIPPPYTCDRSCGPGYIECSSFPNCYNPGQGEICCSDGSYCAAGHYCTNVGCCSDGNSLADCGAAVSLSVIPPSTIPTSSAPTKPTSSATKKTSSATSTTASTVKTTKPSTSTTRTTSSTARTTSSTAGTTRSTTATIISTASTTLLASQLPSYHPPTTGAPNSTYSSTVSATTSTPAQKTANAGQKLEGSVVGFTLCGLSFFLMLL